MEDKLLNLIYNSFRLLINFLQPIKERIANLLKYENKLMTQAELNGYNKISLETCPTKLYLEAINYRLPWIKQPFFDLDMVEEKQNVIESYTLDYRLKYGLYITQEEYDAAKNYIKSLK